MYSTCLYCRVDLGRNQVIESFPVGRRLAVDPARGRLWVICGLCRRWNLSPLEERWEAIESTERIAEKLKAEASSDHIELFTHPGGLKLVRIGAPKWTEFAHWRYGAKLRSRRRWAQVTSTGYLALRVAPYLLLGSAGGLGSFGVGTIAKAVKHQYLKRPVLCLGPIESPTVITGAHLESAWIYSERNGDGLSVMVDSSRGTVSFRDADALRVAGRALLQRNASGASTALIEDAISSIARAGSAEHYFETELATYRARRKVKHFFVDEAEAAVSAPTGAIALIPEDRRIALEIAVHEQLERRALEGELAMLDKMWKEAEEIAAISDSLLVPQFVTDAIRRIRGA